MSREKGRWKIEQRFVSSWLVVGSWWWFTFAAQSSHCRNMANSPNFSDDLVLYDEY